MFRGVTSNCQPFPNPNGNHIGATSPIPSSPKSPYENVTSPYHTYPIPQSPRTRIKTIVGKDRRDNCEIFENRVAISEFQSYGSNGFSNPNYKRSPMIHDSQNFKENMNPLSRSDSSSSVEAPPKPPRSPRIERSILGDDSPPKICKNKSLVKSNYRDHEDSSISSSLMSSSFCSFGASDSRLGQSENEDSMSLSCHVSSNDSKYLLNSFDSTNNNINSSSLSQSLNFSRCSADNSDLNNSSNKSTKMTTSRNNGLSSPRNNSDVSDSGSVISAAIALGESKAGNKVFEEHVIKNIQDTFNIEVSGILIFFATSLTLFHYLPK